MHTSCSSTGTQLLVKPPERVAIFLDFHNLFSAVRDIGGTLDVLRLRNYLCEGRQLVEAFLYIGTRPTHIEGDQHFQRQLRLQNFIVRTKLARFRDDGSLKCDFDAEMAVDVMEFVRKARPNIVVLGSGDGDFSFVAQRLRLHGIRVEVAATRRTVAGELLEAAHGFIDLGAVHSEIVRPSLAFENSLQQEA